MALKYTHLLPLLAMTLMFGHKCDKDIRPPVPGFDRNEVDIIVASLNIAQGWGPVEGRPFQWDNMQKQIQAVDPDVLFMQESIVGFDTSKGEDPVDHPGDAGKLLGMVPTFTSKGVCWTPTDPAFFCGEHGLTTVAPLAPQYVLKGSVYQVLVFEKYAIANVHFTYKKGKQRTGAVKEAEELVEVLEQFPKVILGGDFNAYIGSTALKKFTAAGFKHCGEDEHWRVDHVFVKGGLECRPLQTVKEVASDHRLVYTGIILPPEDKLFLYEQVEETSK